MTKTIYFYSYSGGMVVSEPLPSLCVTLNDTPLEVVPTRLGSPSFRATPQFTHHTFRRNFGAPASFPIQVASFAGPATPTGATVNHWFGPVDELPPNSPALPLDTFMVTAHGALSGEIAETVERWFIRPLLEWVRALTDQWWVGRSYELISGPLHFIAPVDDGNRVVGEPTPVASTTTAGEQMVSVSADIWREAGKRAVEGKPAADKGLATDAKYMFISKEFRSGIILACCAFEAARDKILDRYGKRLRSYDLRKHLSNGFENTFGRNIASEKPELSALLSAFWLARHNAAHGRPIQWRVLGNSIAIEEVSTSEFAEGIDQILRWIDSVRPQENPG